MHGCMHGCKQSAVTFEALIVRLCNLCHSTRDVISIKTIPRGLPYDQSIGTKTRRENNS